MKVQFYFKLIILYFFWLLIITLSNSCVAQMKNIEKAKFERKYKQGEEYQYRLTCEDYKDGKWASTIISVCRLRVVFDSAGVPYDEVNWVSMKQLSPNDTTDKTMSAHLIKPYRISLDPKGTLPLPKLEVAEMTEPITDFNTFFVAVAPTIGVRNLVKAGDSSVMPKPVIGDFSNGKNILKGQDCLLISVRFIGETKQEVCLRTSFIPPSKACFPYLFKEMNTPVIADTLNNFQMVMFAGEKKFHVQYGREYFYINSFVSKVDGKIKRANMYNALNLKMKINCDGSYQNCQTEIPFSEERRLRLELMGE